MSKVYLKLVAILIASSIVFHFIGCQNNRDNSLESSQTCPDINYVNKSSDSCINKEIKDGKIENISVNHCAEDSMSCPFSYNSVFEDIKTENISCLNSNKDNDRYPGEPCLSSDDCTPIIFISNGEEKKNYQNCINNICQGNKENETCSETKSCEVNYFCSSNKKCTLQKQKNEECSSYEECKNNLMCYENKCVDLFSLKQGSNVSAIQDESLNYLCSTDYISNNTCALSKYNTIKEYNSKGYLYCNIGETCNYLIQEEENGKYTEKSEPCKCSLSKHKISYCDLSNDDAITKARMFRLVELKKKLLDNNRHSLQRFKGKINEVRENYSSKCVEFNTKPYYYKMSSYAIDYFGFENCYDILNDYQNYTEIKAFETVSFSTNLNNESIFFLIKEVSQFKIKFNLVNNNKAIARIKLIDYYYLNTISEIDISAALEDFYTTFLFDMEAKTKILISLTFNTKELIKNVDLNFVVEEYSNSINTELIVFPIEKEYNDSLYLKHTSFNPLHQDKFILDLANYHYTDLCLENKTDQEFFYNECKEYKQNIAEDLNISLILSNINNEGLTNAAFYQGSDISSLKDFDLSDSKLYPTTFIADNTTGVMNINKNKNNRYLLVNVDKSKKTTQNDYTTSIFISTPPAVYDNIDLNTETIITFKRSIKNATTFKTYVLNNSKKTTIYEDNLIFYSNNNLYVSIGYDEINTSNLNNDALFNTLESSIINIPINKIKYLQSKVIYLSVLYKGLEDTASFSIFKTKNNFTEVKGSSYKFSYYSVTNTNYLMYTNTNSITTQFEVLNINFTRISNVKYGIFNILSKYSSISELCKETTTNFSQINEITSNTLASFSLKSNQSVLFEISSKSFSTGELRIVPDAREEKEFKLDRRILQTEASYELDSDIVFEVEPRSDITFNIEFVSEIYKYQVILLNNITTNVFLNFKTAEHLEVTKEESVLDFSSTDLTKLIFFNPSKDSKAKIMLSSAKEFEYSQNIVNYKSINNIEVDADNVFKTFVFKVEPYNDNTYYDTHSITIKATSGKFLSLEKNIFPLYSQAQFKNRIYYSEKEIFDYPVVLNDKKNYSISFKNPIESFYILIRLNAQFLRDSEITNYSVFFNRSNQLNIGVNSNIELAFNSNLLSYNFKIENPYMDDLFPIITVAKEIKKDDCWIEINNDKSHYSELVSISNEESLVNAAITKINQKDLQYSSIILICSASEINSNIFIGYVQAKESIINNLNEIKNRHFNMSITAYDNYRKIFFEPEQQFISPFDKVKYYSILIKNKNNDFRDNTEITYYFYLKHKYLFRELEEDFSTNYLNTDLEKNVVYDASLIAIDEYYNVAFCYDTDIYIDPAPYDPSSSSSSSSDKKSDKNDLPWWGIILILLGIILVLILIIFGVKLLSNTRRRNNEESMRALIIDL